jgi:hypothetical protein
MCIGRSDYPFGRKDEFSRPEYFNGQNAIVVVNVHRGFNQEDSLVAYPCRETLARRGGEAWEEGDSPEKS